MGATLAFRTRDAIQSQILLGPGDVTASQIPAGIPNGETKLPRPEVLDAEMTSELSAGQKSDPDYGAAELASFDVTRLTVGRRYEFTLAGGGKVMGVLRELEASSSDRGEPSLRVTDESHDQYLDPRQVVAVRRSRGQS